MNDRARLLEVRNLETTFPSDAGPIRAVDGVTFEVRTGERVGIAGESGSGKTVTALTMMGLVPVPPAQVSGEVLFDGTNLLGLSQTEMRRIRGDRIGMIFQNPMDCLNPSMTVGAQIMEAILAHRRVPRREARERAVELLASVGIPFPARSADEYPHRFSGGMRQRVMIAVALSCEPDLVVADEPTTALDVTIQAQIIDLLARMCQERGVAVILITHDLALLAGFADRIVVMYAGRIMEEGDVETIYYHPSHPYTWGLLTSITRVDEPRRERLSPIRGNPPSPIVVPSGCVFHPRCPYVQDVCRSEIPGFVVRPGDDHPSACHFSGELAPPAHVGRTAS